MVVPGVAEAVDYDKAEVQQRLACLDNSARDLLAQCPQKFWWRYGLLLVPESEHESWPLTFGSAIHKAYECGDVESAVAAFHAAYDEAGHGPTPEQTEQVRAEKYANQQKAHTHAPDRGESMVRGYFELFPPEKARWSVEACEVQLSYEVASGWMYYGTIDKALHWLIGGRPFPLDHKTTGGQRGSADLITNPHNQMLGYLWLMLAQDPSQSVDPREEFDYIIDVSVKDSTIAGKKYKDGSAFDRVHERVAYWQVMRWHRDVLTVYEDVQHYFRQGTWRRETRSCNDFFTPCPYLALCRSECPEPAEIGYVVEQWGPAFDA